MSETPMTGFLASRPNINDRKKHETCGFPSTYMYNIFKAVLSFTG